MELVRAVIGGSGSSSSTPFLNCATSRNPCRTCADALENPKGRNHRLNPSFLLQLRHPQDGTLHNILVDCGKTFRETAIKVFPSHGVRDLSAVLLTHDHADACYGLDDLREFNRLDDTSGDGIDVYADGKTLQSVHRVFRYLFPAVVDGDAKLVGVGAGSGTNYHEKKTNWTAALTWHCMEPGAVESVHVRARLPDPQSPQKPSAIWQFVPIPVLHGPDYYSNAFLMRLGHSARKTVSFLLYASDVSDITEEFLLHVAMGKQALCVGEEVPDPQLEVLLLDMTSRRSYPSHMSVSQSLSAATQMGARSTIFVGMSHTLEYNDMMQELRDRGLSANMTIGYDGMVVWEESELDSGR